MSAIYTGALTEYYICAHAYMYVEMACVLKEWGHFYCTCIFMYI